MLRIFMVSTNVPHLLSNSKVVPTSISVSINQTIHKICLSLPVRSCAPFARGLIVHPKKESLFYPNMHPGFDVIHLFYNQQGQIRDWSLSMVLKVLTGLVHCPNRPIT